MQISSYPSLNIISTLFKPAIYMNPSEAADNLILIHNHYFTIQQNKEKTEIR